MPTKTTAKTASRPARSGADTWTDEERAAMQERVREVKAASGKEEDRELGEAEVRAKLAEMPEADRTKGERIAEIVRAAAPHLVPRTYYGMPAWAKDGRTICFFKPASKFKVRYATFEFQPDARLDDGTMWPVGFALIDLTPADETRIAELVKRAAA